MGFDTINLGWYIYATQKLSSRECHTSRYKLSLIDTSLRVQDIHIGHRDQDGKKVDEMSLFFLKWEAGMDR